MRQLTIAAAVAALSFSYLPAVSAQSLAQNAGPANLPPAGFSGRSFVDANGCIFIRAGSGARVNWVPQVTRDAKLVCGFQPTFSNGSANKPAASVAQPKISAQPVQIARLAPVTQAAPTAPAANLPVPKGYVAAWDDGRLNPNRGPRTTAGNEQMALIWTDSVPMKRPGAKAPATGSNVAQRTRSSKASGSVASVVDSLTNKYLLSSKSEAASGKFIQIGAYGLPQNADRAVAKVQALGLPAVGQARQMNGQAVTVVLAGPVSPHLAAEAQKILRAAGYSDAFIR